MTHPTREPAPACSLSVAEGAERAARWRTLLDTHLLSRTATAFGQRLAFPNDPHVRGELETLVAAERDCCPFLDLTVERFDEALILDLGGPPEASEIVATMFGSAS